MGGPHLWTYDNAEVDRRVLDRLRNADHYGGRASRAWIVDALTDRAVVIQVALPVPVAAASWSGLSRVRVGTLRIAA